MLPGQALLDQLWDCMDDSLERADNNDGADTCASKDDFMKRIKALAVMGQNIHANRVQFLQMGQERDEPIALFLSRLRGQGNLCSFQVECTECKHKTSYQEEIMSHQLIRALVDS